MNDTRPLVERVQALANRFDAMAIGAEKSLALPVAENHRRDARTLRDAAERIKELEAALKLLSDLEIPGEIDSLPDDHGCRYYFTFGEIRMARALLKEPDQ